MVLAFSQTALGNSGPSVLLRYFDDNQKNVMWRSDIAWQREHMLDMIRKETDHQCFREMAPSLDGELAQIKKQMGSRKVNIRVSIEAQDEDKDHQVVGTPYGTFPHYKAVHRRPLYKVEIEETGLEIIPPSMDNYIVTQVTQTLKEAQLREVQIDSYTQGRKSLYLRRWLPQKGVCKSAFPQLLKKAWAQHQDRHEEYLKLKAHRDYSNRRPPVESPDLLKTTEVQGSR